MRFRNGLAYVRGALVMMGLWWCVGAAQAANDWENGKTLFNNTCNVCHNGPGQSSQSYFFPAGYSAEQIRAAIEGGVSQMAGLSVSADQRSDIAAYFGHTTFPLASLSPSSRDFGEVPVGFPKAPTSFRLTNNGDAALNVGAISITNGSKYTLSNDCGGSVAFSGKNYCDISVTFNPTTADAANAASRTDTLTVAGLNTVVTTRTATVLTKPRAPVELTTSSLTFMQGGAQPLTTTITDRVGGAIQVCRAPGTPLSLSFPSDYTIDGYTLSGDSGCATIPAGAVGATGRTINLNVRFSPGAVGPRNGSFTVQRVANDVPALTIALQGNPGPFATVDATHLFDNPGDDGVEIDNDNVLERQFTVFSKGSQPLVFTAGSFIKSGTYQGDYTLLQTGCLAAGFTTLPAFTSQPAPSCVVTVRFNPSDVGLRSPASLTVAFAGSPDNVVQLRGTGIRGPRLAVRRGATALASGDIVQFSGQTIGGLYAPISVTLHNGGTVGALEMLLPASGTVDGFRFTPGACASIAAAADCTLDLYFDPSTVKSYTTPLTIQTRPAGSAAAYDSFGLSLRGDASASAVPTLSWTNQGGTAITQLAFSPAVDIGSPVTQKIFLYNDGPGGVALQLANLIGLDGQNFLLDTTDCASGKTLYEKSSCAILVQFAPGTPGAKAASIQFAATANTPPTLVVPGLLAVSGTATGVAVPATLTGLPTSMSFPVTTAGSAALPQEVTLSNESTRGLLISSMSVAAPFSVQLKSCPALPFMLAAGNSCTVNVIFTPQGEGTQSGILRVSTDGTPDVIQVTLSATAEPKANTNSSGGGCAITSGGAALDPALWTMVLLAIGVLFARRRRGR